MKAFNHVSYLSWDFMVALKSNHSNTRRRLRRVCKKFNARNALHRWNLWRTNLVIIIAVTKDLNELQQHFNTELTNLRGRWNRPLISLFVIELKLVQKPLGNYMKASGCWMGLVASLTTKTRGILWPLRAGFGMFSFRCSWHFRKGRTYLKLISKSIKAWSLQIYANPPKNPLPKILPLAQDVTERQRREKLSAKRPNSPKEPSNRRGDAGTFGAVVVNLSVGPFVWVNKERL